MTNKKYQKYIETAIPSPAYICDINSLNNSLYFHRQFCDKYDCKILFPLKTFTLKSILTDIQKKVDGFSVSSFFEAKLAKEILNQKQTVHFTSPCIKESDIEKLSQLVDYFAFNSIAHYEKYDKLNIDTKSAGIRINPNLSANIDERYNPCCKNSKLGVPIEQFIQYPKLYNNNIKGILFHTNCDSSDFQFLDNTFSKIEQYLEKFLKNINWINFGGGYLLEDSSNLEILGNLIAKIKNKYGLKVFIEPGASIIRNSCDLVSTVVDIFKSYDKYIAILDTTINHLPEVLEFGYRLEVYNELPNGKYEYILAGASCLAGDKFGTYKFDKPLEIGSKIIFKNIGAYSIVKANMFNGINMPCMYQYNKDNNLVLIKKYTYDDFINRYI